MSGSGGLDYDPNSDRYKHGQLPLQEGHYQYYPRFFPNWGWSSATGSSNMAYSGEGQFYVIGEDGKRVDPSMSGRMYDNATYLGYKTQRSGGGSYTFRPGSETTESTEFTSKGESKRRCCVIAAIVGLFFLVAAGIAIGIYFGVVDKPESKEINDTPAAPPTEAAFDLTLTRDIPYDTNLNNPLSTEYKELKAEVENQIDSAFANSDQSSVYKKSIVTGFSPGSTIVYVRSEFKATSYAIGNQVISVTPVTVQENAKAGLRRNGNPTFFKVDTLVATVGSNTATSDLGEQCTAVTDCLDKNVNCMGTPAVCTCLPDFYDINDLTQGGTCVEKVAYGVRCTRAIHCKTTGAECSNSQCRCPTNQYFDGISKCLNKIGHDGEGCTNASVQCITGNAICMGGNCSCAATDFLRGQDCMSKIAINQTRCSADSECSTSNSICVSNRCQCININYYNQASDECKPKLNIGDSCAAVLQCLTSEAVCDVTCQCDGGKYESNGVCLNKKPIGNSCDRTVECLAGSCSNNTCACPSTTYQDGNACLNKKEYEANCTNAIQCSTSNSTCSDKCVCASNYYFDSTTNTCKMKKANGDSCALASQCLVDRAICDSSQQNTCQCPTGNYSSGTECLPKKVNGQSCDLALECSFSNTGCIEKTCQCPSDRFVQGSACMPKVANGGVCVTDMYCSFSYASCATDSNTCVCPPTTFEVLADKECRPKVANGGDCVTDMYCSFSNASCASDSNTCVCPPTTFEVLADKECRQKKTIGGECDDVSQCEFSLAECNTTCNCPDGYFVDGSSCTKKKDNGNLCTANDECSASGAVCQGTCSCSNTSVLINGVCKPKVGYEGTCDNTAECSTEKAQCSNRSCVCPTNYFFDVDKCSEKLGMGETCETKPECSYVLSICSSQQCTCPTDRYADDDKKECVEKKNIGGDCSEDKQCGSFGAKCITSKCACPSTTFNNGTACLEKINYGLACTQSLECRTDGAACNSASKTCLCVEGDYLDNNTVCRNKTANGGNCTSSESCLITEAQCISDKCACKTTQYENGDRCSDKKGYGELCGGTNECSFTNATCSDTCACTSTSYFDGTMCKKKIEYGGTCSGSDLQCMTSKGRCQDTVCKCNDNYYYDSTTDKCILKVVIGRDCTGNNQCITGNSICDTSVCACPAERYLGDTACLLKKEIEVSCQSVEECKTSNASCIDVCTCGEDKYRNGDSCQPKKSNGEICSNTFECSYKNADCFGAFCQCQDSMYESGTSCLPKKLYGVSCLEDKECSDAVGSCVNSYCGCTDVQYYNGSQCQPKVIYDGACNTSEACSTKDADCLSEKCQCTSDRFLSENKCLQKIGAGQQCTGNGQCSVNGSVCQTGQCTCPSSLILNGDQTACVTKKGPGENCTSASECLIVGSECNVISQCACPANKYSDGTQCLPKKVNGSPCSNVIECVSGNSLCHQNVCACSNTDYLNGDQCSLRLGYGDSCTVDEACMLMFVCTNLTCQCEAGKFYNGSACDIVTTTTPIPTTRAPDEVVTVAVDSEIVVDIPYNNDLSNTSSEAFKKTAADVRAAVLNSANDSSISDVEVDSFQSGSTSCNYRLILLLAKLLSGDDGTVESAEDLNQLDTRILARTSAIVTKFDNEIKTSVGQVFNGASVKSSEVQKINKKPCEDPNVFLGFAQSRLCQAVLSYFLKLSPGKSFCLVYNVLLDCIFNPFVLDGQQCNWNYGRTIFQTFVHGPLGIGSDTVKELDCIAENYYSFVPIDVPDKTYCNDMTTMKIISEFTCSDDFNDLLHGQDPCTAAINLEECTYLEVNKDHNCTSRQKNTRMSEMVDYQGNMFGWGLTNLQTCEFCIAPNLRHIMNEYCGLAFALNRDSDDLNQTCGALHDEMLCIEAHTSFWETPCNMTSIKEILKSNDGYKRLPSEILEVDRSLFEECIDETVFRVGKKEPATLCENQNYIWYLMKNADCGFDIKDIPDDLQCSILLPKLECVLEILHKEEPTCEFETVLFRMFGQLDEEQNDNNIVDLMDSKYAGCADSYREAKNTEVGMCHLYSFRALPEARSEMEKFMRLQSPNPVLVQALSKESVICSVQFEILDSILSTVQERFEETCPIEIMRSAGYVLMTDLQLVDEIPECDFAGMEDSCSTPSRLFLESVIKCGDELMGDSKNADEMSENWECRNYRMYTACVDQKMRTCADSRSFLKNPMLQDLLQQLYGFPKECMGPLNEICDPEIIDRAVNESCVKYMEAYNASNYQCSELEHLIGCIQYTALGHDKQCDLTSLAQNVMSYATEKAKREVSLCLPTGNGSRIDELIALLPQKIEERCFNPFVANAILQTECIDFPIAPFSPEQQCVMEISVSGCLKKLLNNNVFQPCSDEEITTLMQDETVRQKNGFLPASSKPCADVYSYSQCYKETLMVFLANEEAANCFIDAYTLSDFSLLNLNTDVNLLQDAGGKSLLKCSYIETGTSCFIEKANPCKTDENPEKLEKILKGINSALKSYTKVVVEESKLDEEVVSFLQVPIYDECLDDLVSLPAYEDCPSLEDAVENVLPGCSNRLNMYEQDGNKMKTDLEECLYYQNCITGSVLSRYPQCFKEGNVADNIATAIQSHPTFFASITDLQKDVCFGSTDDICNPYNIAKATEMFCPKYMEEYVKSGYDCRKLEFWIGCLWYNAVAREETCDVKNLSGYVRDYAMKKQEQEASLCSPTVDGEDRVDEIISMLPETIQGRCASALIVRAILETECITYPLEPFTAEELCSIEISLRGCIKIALNSNNNIPNQCTDDQIKEQFQDATVRDKLLPATTQPCEDNYQFSECYIETVQMLGANAEAASCFSDLYVLAGISMMGNVDINNMVGVTGVKPLKCSTLENGTRCFVVKGNACGSPSENQEIQADILDAIVESMNLYAKVILEMSGLEPDVRSVVEQLLISYDDCKENFSWLPSYQMCPTEADLLEYVLPLCLNGVRMYEQGHQLTDYEKCLTYEGCYNSTAMSRYPGCFEKSLIPSVMEGAIQTYPVFFASVTELQADSCIGIKECFDKVNGLSATCSAGFGYLMYLATTLPYGYTCRLIDPVFEDSMQCYENSISSEFCSKMQLEDIADTFNKYTNYTLYKDMCKGFSFSPCDSAEERAVLQCISQLGDPCTYWGCVFNATEEFQCDRPYSADKAREFTKIVASGYVPQACEADPCTPGYFLTAVTETCKEPWTKFIENEHCSDYESFLLCIKGQHLVKYGNTEECLLTTINNNVEKQLEARKLAAVFCDLKYTTEPIFDGGSTSLVEMEVMEGKVKFNIWTNIDFGVYNIAVGLQYTNFSGDYVTISKEGGEILISESFKDDESSKAPSNSDNSYIINDISRQERDFVYIEVTCNKDIEPESDMLVVLRWPIGETDANITSEPLTLDEFNYEGRLTNLEKKLPTEAAEFCNIDIVLADMLNYGCLNEDYYMTTDPMSKCLYEKAATQCVHSILLYLGLSACDFDTVKDNLNSAYIRYKVLNETKSNCESEYPCLERVQEYEVSKNCFEASEKLLHLPVEEDEIKDWNTTDGQPFVCRAYELSLRCAEKTFGEVIKSSCANISDFHSAIQSSIQVGAALKYEDLPLSVDVFKPCNSILDEYPELDGCPTMDDIITGVVAYCYAKLVTDTSNLNPCNALDECIENVKGDYRYIFQACTEEPNVEDIFEIAMNKDIFYSTVSGRFGMDLRDCDTHLSIAQERKEYKVTIEFIGQTFMDVYQNETEEFTESFWNLVYPTLEKIFASYEWSIYSVDGGMGELMIIFNATKAPGLDVEESAAKCCQNVVVGPVQGGKSCPDLFNENEDRIMKCFNSTLNILHAGDLGLDLKNIMVDNLKYDLPCRAYIFDMRCANYENSHILQLDGTQPQCNLAKDIHPEIMKALDRTLKREGKDQMQTSILNECPDQIDLAFECPGETALIDHFVSSCAYTVLSTEPKYICQAASECMTKSRTSLDIYLNDCYDLYQLMDKVKNSSKLTQYFKDVTGFDLDGCHDGGPTDINPCIEESYLYEAVDTCYKDVTDGLKSMPLLEPFGPEACSLFYYIESCIDIMLSKSGMKCYEYYEMDQRIYNKLVEKEGFPRLSINATCHGDRPVCTARGIIHAVKEVCMTDYVLYRTNWLFEPLKCRNETDREAVKDILTCVRLEALSKGELNCAVKNMMDIIASDYNYLGLLSSDKECISDETIQALDEELNESVCTSEMAIRYFSKKCRPESNTMCTSKAVSSPGFSKNVTCLLYLTGVQCVEMELKKGKFECTLDDLTSEGMSNNLPVVLNKTQLDYCDGPNYGGSENFESCTYPLIRKMNESMGCYRHLFNVSKDLPAERKCSLYHLTKDCWSEAFDSESFGCEQSLVDFRVQHLMPDLLDTIDITMQARTCFNYTRLRTNFSSSYLTCRYGDLPEAFDLCSDTSELRNRTLMDLVNASCSREIKRFGMVFEEEQNNPIVGCILLNRYTECGVNATKALSRDCSVEDVRSTLVTHKDWLEHPFDKPGFDLGMCQEPCYMNLLEELENCLDWRVTDQITNGYAHSCRFFGYMMTCMQPDDQSQDACDQTTRETFVKFSLLGRHYEEYDHYYMYNHDFLDCEVEYQNMCTDKGVEDLAYLGFSYCYGKVYDMEAVGCEAAPGLYQCLEDFVDVYGDCEKDQEKKDDVIFKAILKLGTNVGKNFRHCRSNNSEGYCPMGPYKFQRYSCSPNRTDTCYADNMCVEGTICCYDGCSLSCTDPATETSTFSLWFTLTNENMKEEYNNLAHTTTKEFLQRNDNLFNDLLKELGADSFEVQELTSSGNGMVMVYLELASFVDLEHQKVENILLGFEGVIFYRVQYVLPGPREGECPKVLSKADYVDYCMMSDNDCPEPKKCCPDMDGTSFCMEPIHKEDFPSCESAEEVIAAASQCDVDLTNIQHFNCSELLHDADCIVYHQNKERQLNYECTRKNFFNFVSGNDNNVTLTEGFKCEAYELKLYWPNQLSEDTFCNTTDEYVTRALIYIENYDEYTFHRGERDRNCDIGDGFTVVLAVDSTDIYGLEETLKTERGLDVSIIYLSQEIDRCRDMNTLKALGSRCIKDQWYRVYKEWQNCQPAREFKDCMAMRIKDNFGDDCSGRIHIFDDPAEKVKYIEFLRTLPDPYGYSSQVIEKLENHDAQECRTTGDVSPCLKKDLLDSTFESCLGVIGWTEENSGTFGQDEICSMFFKLQDCVDSFTSTAENKCYENGELENLMFEKFTKEKMKDPAISKFDCLDKRPVCSGRGLLEVIMKNCMNDYVRYRTDWLSHSFECINETDRMAIKEIMICVMLTAFDRGQEDCTAMVVKYTIETFVDGLSLLTSLEDCISEEELENLDKELSSKESVCSSPAVIGKFAKPCIKPDFWKDGCVDRSTGYEMGALCSYFINVTSCTRDQIHYQFESLTCSPETIMESEIFDVLKDRDSCLAKLSERDVCFGDHIRYEVEGCVNYALSELMYSGPDNYCSILDKAVNCLLYLKPTCSEDELSALVINMVDMYKVSEVFCTDKDIQNNPLKHCRGPAVEARPGQCPTHCMEETNMVSCENDDQCGDRQRCCQCDSKPVCIQAIPEDGAPRQSVSLAMPDEFNPDLEDSTSSVYQTLSLDILGMLRDVLAGSALSTNFFKAHVVGYRNGSTIVQVILQFLSRNVYGQDIIIEPEVVLSNLREGLLQADPDMFLLDRIVVEPLPDFICVPRNVESAIQDIKLCHEIFVQYEDSGFKDCRHFENLALCITYNALTNFEECDIEDVVDMLKNRAWSSSEAVPEVCEDDGNRLEELRAMLPMGLQDICYNIKLGQILLEYVCVDFDVRILENDTQCIVEKASRGCMLRELNNGSISHRCSRLDVYNLMAQSEVRSIRFKNPIETCPDSDFDPCYLETIEEVYAYHVETCFLPLTSFPYLGRKVDETQSISYPEKSLKCSAFERTVNCIWTSKELCPNSELRGDKVKAAIKDFSDIYMMISGSMIMSEEDAEMEPIVFNDCVNSTDLFGEYDPHCQSDAAFVETVMSQCGFRLNQYFKDSPLQKCIAYEGCINSTVPTLLRNCEKTDILNFTKNAFTNPMYTSFIQSFDSDVDFQYCYDVGACQVGFLEHGSECGSLFYMVYYYGHYLSAKQQCIAHQALQAKGVSCFRANVPECAEYVILDFMEMSFQANNFSNIGEECQDEAYDVCEEISVVAVLSCITELGNPCQFYLCADKVQNEFCDSEQIQGDSMIAEVASVLFQGYQPIRPQDCFEKRKFPFKLRKEDDQEYNEDLNDPQSSMFWETKAQIEKEIDQGMRNSILGPLLADIIVSGFESGSLIVKGDLVFKDIKVNNNGTMVEVDAEAVRVVLNDNLPQDYDEEFTVVGKEAIGPGTVDEKPGYCPLPGVGICQQECNKNKDCEEEGKSCCFNGCGHVCAIPGPNLECLMDDDVNGFGTDMQSCDDSNHCGGKQKCCSKQCTDPVTSCYEVTYVMQKLNMTVNNTFMDLNRQCQMLFTTVQRLMEKLTHFDFYIISTCIGQIYFGDAYLVNECYDPGQSTNRPGYNNTDRPWYTGHTDRPDFTDHTNSYGSWPSGSGSHSSSYDGSHSSSYNGSHSSSYEGSYSSSYDGSHSSSYDGSHSSSYDGSHSSSYDGSHSSSYDGSNSSSYDGSHSSSYNGSHSSSYDGSYSSSYDGSYSSSYDGSHSSSYDGSHSSSYDGSHSSSYDGSYSSSYDGSHSSSYDGSHSSSYDGSHSSSYDGSHSSSYDGSHSSSYDGSNSSSYDGSHSSSYDGSHSSSYDGSHSSSYDGSYSSSYDGSHSSSYDGSHSSSYDGSYSSSYDGSHSSSYDGSHSSSYDGSHSSSYDGSYSSSYDGSHSSSYDGSHSSSYDGSHSSSYDGSHYDGSHSSSYDGSHSSSYD